MRFLFSLIDLQTSKALQNYEFLRFPIKAPGFKKRRKHKANVLYKIMLFIKSVFLFHIPAEHRFPNAVICNIVFLVDRQYLLPLKVLAFYLIE